MIYGYVYRHVMRLAHRFYWHYAPPIYPTNNSGLRDKQLWCQWCGFRQTIVQHQYGQEIPTSPMLDWMKKLSPQSGKESK